MYFPKRWALSLFVLILLFGAGLLIFVYFQGGLEHSLRAFSPGYGS